MTSPSSCAPSGILGDAQLLYSPTFIQQEALLVTTPRPYLPGFNQGSQPIKDAGIALNCIPVLSQGCGFPTSSSATLSVRCWEGHTCLIELKSLLNWKIRLKDRSGGECLPSQWSRGRKGSSRQQRLQNVSKKKKKKDWGSLQSLHRTMDLCLPCVSESPLKCFFPRCEEGSGSS